MGKKPGKDSFPDNPETSLRAFKRGHVRRVLEACGGDIEQAARLLGVKPQTVIRWVRDTRGESEDEPPPGETA